MASYRDLVAWQKAMQFVLQVYEASNNFPREELFGLKNQLRRAWPDSERSPALITSKEGKLITEQHNNSARRGRNQVILAGNLASLRAIMQQSFSGPVVNLTGS